MTDDVYFSCSHRQRRRCKPYVSLPNPGAKISKNNRIDDPAWKYEYACHGESKKKKKKTPTKYRHYPSLPSCCIFRAIRKKRYVSVVFFFFRTTQEGETASFTRVDFTTAAGTTPLLFAVGTYKQAIRSPRSYRCGARVTSRDGPIKRPFRSRALPGQSF